MSTASERKKERDRVRQQWRTVYAWYLKLLVSRGIITEEERRGIRV